MDLTLLDELKAACKGAAAKLDITSDNSGEIRYLHLWNHLAETGFVMERIFEEQVPEQTKRVFYRDVPGCNETLLRKIFILAGLLHDLGKMSLVFQKRILAHAPEWNTFELGLEKCCSGSAYAHHSLLSMVITAHEKLPTSFCSVLGAHHSRSYLRNIESIDTYAEALTGSVPPDQDWLSAWNEICSVCIRMAGFSSASEVPELPITTAVLLTGYLVRADWIASNVVFFPLLPLNETLSPSDYPKRFSEGWEALGLPPVWKASADFSDLDSSHFCAEFGFPSLNSLQKNVLDVCTNTDDPGLLIVEAQMGTGKTEASLIAAEVFAHKSGAGGIGFFLPTQATANGLLPRFLEWVQSTSTEQSPTFRLAHSAASLNEEFLNLPYRKVDIDFDGAVNQGAKTREEDKSCGSADSVLMHQWMQGSKRSLLSNFVIGTIDQALLAASIQSFYMLGQTGLAEKIVIIDEIHSYDAYMSKFLLHFLEWMGAYHVPVILLSATLSAAARTSLVDAYLKGRAGSTQPGSRRGRRRSSNKSVEKPVWKSSQSYPLLTWTDGSQASCRSFDQGQASKEISLIKKPLLKTDSEADLIFQILKERSAEAGCTAIIVNSVRNAQRLADELSRKLPAEYRIVVIHSRFTRADRAELEKKVIRFAGKKSADSDREKLLVIGTQVLEQSLDLDFDFMITELCPIDLLFQRLGRLHRHDRRERPKRLSEPECFVLFPATEDLAFDSSCRSVYSPWILRQTLNSLPVSVSLPEDIPSLVNQVYPSNFADLLQNGDQYDPEMEKYLESHLQKEASAEGFTLKYRRDILGKYFGMNGLTAGTMSIPDHQAQSIVRDADPSLSVILLIKNDDETFSPLSNPSFSVSTNQVPDRKTAVKLLASQVQFPPAGTDIDHLKNLLQEKENYLFSKWKEQPLLHFELFLVLDRLFEADLGRYRLSYSRQTGLILIRDFHAD